MDDKLLMISCSPECGFKIQSHDEEEVMAVAKAHISEKHGKDVSGVELSQMMQVVG